MAYRVDKKTAYLRLGRKESLTSAARETRTTEAGLIRQAIGKKPDSKIRPRPKCQSAARDSAIRLPPNESMTF